jgi:hypothetical protein
MSDKPQVDENTLRTMEALLRQPPKPHDEMKLESLGAKRQRVPRNGRAGHKQNDGALLG